MACAAQCHINDGNNNNDDNSSGEVRDVKGGGVDNSSNSNGADNSNNNGAASIPDNIRDRPGVSIPGTPGAAADCTPLAPLPFSPVPDLVAEHTLPFLVANLANLVTDRFPEELDNPEPELELAEALSTPEANLSPPFLLLLIPLLLNHPNRQKTQAPPKL